MGSSPPGVVSWSADSAATSISAELEHDALTHLGLKRIHTEDRARLDAAFNEGRQGKPVFIVYRALTSDDHAKWLAVDGTLAADKRWSGTVIDLVETLGDGRRIDQFERYATIIEAVNAALGPQPDAAGL